MAFGSQMEQRPRTAETIMLIGRWSSNAYVRYLQMNDVRRRKISQSMASVSTEMLDDARERGDVGDGDRWAREGL